MPQAVQSILDQVHLSTIVDIGITAVLIYWLFLLIRGTRAVRLVIGVSVLIAVYAAARLFNLPLLRQILETGAIVGVFALVVVFQPELRRALERIGRVGSLAWLFSPVDERTAEHVAAEIARAATVLAAQDHGALIVIERQTGLEEFAETGVMIHADLSADLLVTIFMPKTALHDGAVIIRGEQIVAAGALLPLAEMTVQAERLGTRHRAALGIAEETDAVVVVVSEESGQVSLVERSRIRRNLNEAQMTRALAGLLRPGESGRTLVKRGSGAVRSVAVARPSGGQVARLRRSVRRSTGLSPIPPVDGPADGDGAVQSPEGDLAGATSAATAQAAKPAGSAAAKTAGSAAAKVDADPAAPPNSDGAAADGDGASAARTRPDRHDPDPRPAPAAPAARR
jgi:diadenylate cyclase